MKVFLKFISVKMKSHFSLLIIFIFLISTQTLAATPNDVYQSASNLVLNIEKIRENQKITKPARKPGVQIAKSPLNAFTKALEVHEKTIRYKKSKGWTHRVAPSLPSKKVTPDDVLEVINIISDELMDINKKLSITFTQSASLPVSKTPSDVYERLWQASYLLDGLVGPIGPSFVHRNTLRIERSLLNLANQLNKSEKIKAPEVTKGKKPIDANIEGFKVMYQLVKLEKQLGLSPVRVSGFPAGNISPSDVYDTTNNIISELTRINLKLSLPTVPDAELSKEKITPNEVIYQFKKIQRLISNISS